MQVYVSKQDGVTVTRFNLLPSDIAKKENKR